MKPSGSRPAPRGLISLAARLTPASLLVQILSFGSSIALATQLGATTATDAYYLALSVPAIAYGVLVAALRLGAIPPLTNVFVEDSSEAFDRSSQEVLTSTFLAALALSVVVTGAMLVILPLAASGTAHLTSLTRLFIVELLPYAVTGAMLGSLGSVLAVRGRFITATLVLTFEPVLKSVLVIAFGRQLGAQSLVIGNLVGNLLAVWVLWTLVQRVGVRIKARRLLYMPLLRRSDIVRDMMKLSVPLVVSQSLLQLNPLIDRATAASLGGGKVTTFELGVRLFNVPTSLLTGVVIAPLAATWAARFASDGWEAITRSFSRIVVGIVLIVPPLIVLGFILRRELVSVVYLNHRYTLSDVRQTADVLGMLLLGLIPQILGVPLATLFIVRRDTVFPMKVGIANVVLNAVLDVVLRGPFGLPGIAFSTALTLTILSGVFYREAVRRWGAFHMRIALRPLMLSGCSCVALGVSAWALQRAAGPADSRWDALAVLSGISVVALLIHGLALAVGRSTIVDVLPVAARFPLGLRLGRRAA